MLNDFLNVRFGSIPAILIPDWDTTLDGIVLPEEIWKAECGYSADQNFGELDGVQGGRREQSPV